MAENLDNVYGALPTDPTQDYASGGGAESAEGRYSGLSVTYFENSSSLLTLASTSDLASAMGEGVEGNVMANRRYRAGSLREATEDALEKATQEEELFAGIAKAEQLLSQERAKKEVHRLLEYYVDKMPDLGSEEELRAFAKKLKELPDPSPRNLRDAAKNRFQDLSHQYAALAIAEEFLQADKATEPSLLTNLHKAQETLFQQHGPNILAGLNITQTAIQFSPFLGTVKDLRDLYRDLIVSYQKAGYDSILETLEDLITKNGENNLGKSISYLIKALGSDLSAQTVSTSREHLTSTLEDLFKVEVLGNVHRNLSNLLGRVVKNFEAPVQIQPIELLKTFVKLIEERYITLHQITALATLTGLKENLSAKIFFLTQLKELIRSLPFKIFPQEANLFSNRRDQFYQAASAAVEEAIIEEQAKGG